MPRLIVLPQEANGKPLGPNSRVLLLRRKGKACCKSANIRQVLLKFILGPAFHLFLHRKGGVCHVNPFPLQLLPRSEIGNSTEVAKERNRRGLTKIAHLDPCAGLREPVVPLGRGVGTKSGRRKRCIQSWHLTGRSSNRIAISPLSSLGGKCKYPSDGNTDSFQTLLGAKLYSRRYQ